MESKPNITSALRPPGTTIKPQQAVSKLSALGSYTALNKHQAIKPSDPSNTLIRPLHRLQMQHQDHPNYHPSSSAKVVQPSQSQTQAATISPQALTSHQTNTKTITRIPAKPSGLARPTPIKHIVISASSSQQGSLTNLAPSSAQPIKSATSGNGSRLPSTLSGSSSRLAQLRHGGGGGGGGMLSTQHASKSPSGAAVFNTSPTDRVNRVTSTTSTGTIEKPRALPRTLSPSCYPVRSPVRQLRSTPSVLAARRDGSYRTITTTITNVISSSSSSSSSSAAVASRSTSRASDEALSGSAAARAAAAEPKTTNSNDQQSYVTNIIDLSSVENDVGEIRKMVEQLLVLLKDHELVVAENERLRIEVSDLREELAANGSTTLPDDSIDPGSDHNNTRNIDNINHNNINNNINDTRRPPSSIYMSPMI